MDNNQAAAGEVRGNFLVTDITTAEHDRHLSLVKMTAIEPGERHASTGKPIGILQLTITDPEQWAQLALHGSFACTFAPVEPGARAEQGAGARETVQA